MREGVPATFVVAMFHCIKIFVRLIFVVDLPHKNILPTKISRITVLVLFFSVGTLPFLLLILLTGYSVACTADSSF